MKDRISRIDHRQRLMRRGQRAAEPPTRLIPSLPREGDPPLSSAQERVWFLDRLDPDRAAFNPTLTGKICGNIDIHILQETFIRLSNRHEILKYAFVEVGGSLVQKVRPLEQMRVSVLDLSGLSASRGELESRQVADLAALQSFDLTKGPLIRAVAVRLNPREHLLLCVLHQIISDSWSLWILIDELTTIYSSLASGLPSTLPSLALQYADYAIWERHWLSSERARACLAYWQQRLAGMAVLELPTDRPRPLVPSSATAQLLLRLDASLRFKVEALSREESTTAFITIMAVLQSLLSRWANQDDVPIGSLFDGRTMVELEGLIGRFSRLVTLRGDFAGNPTFKEILQGTEEIVLGAIAHQDIPFEIIVESLSSNRELSREPLFQVLFTYDLRRPAALRFGDLSLEQAATCERVGHYDLELRLYDREEEWDVVFVYRRDLFDMPSVQRLSSRFATLLRKIVDTSGQRLSEYQLLPDTERAQLLWEWNDTAGEHSKLCLHDLFVAQAARTPDATALIWGTQRITYRYLDAQSNRLARRLRHLGVGPEVRVAICLERSPDLVVSLLAVLKAGGAYVPLDPRHPANRLSAVLDDSEAFLLIGDQDLASIFPYYRPSRFLLNEERDNIKGCSDAPLTAGSEDRNLAYIIYTSGSTGRPKGVAIEHRSATMFVLWAAKTYSLEELAGVLAGTTIIFDLSVFELYVPLAVGGKVILVPDLLGQLKDGDFSEVTLINTVPSVAKILFGEGGPSSGPLTVNVAGEAVSRETVNTIHRFGSVRRVFNLYGPSEDTTYSTCEKLEVHGEGLPSIGRPITGKFALILDKYLNLAPLGTLGELWLGGIGLARGYLNAPSLTADRFRPNPFGEDHGSRIYRTGDVARYQRDGRLDFLGRVDVQIKVRGIRIEVGEVEAALAMHPNVRAAVVVARKNGVGETELVAYVVPVRSSISAQAFRSHLGHLLPVAMVPSVFVMLDALPLTANGKVDRRALPDPEKMSEGQRGELYVSPRTHLESVLADIWREVLGVTRVSVHDNFFELGGHSISAAVVLNRLRELLGIEISFGAIFQYPTLDALARSIEEARGSARRTERRKYSRGRSNRSRTARASFAQERFWFLAELGADDISYNVPVALRLEGCLDYTALEAALSKIRKRHRILRSTYVLESGRVIQRVDSLKRPCVSLVDLQGLAVEGASDTTREAWRIWDQEAIRRFDLSRGPLMRVILLRLNDSNHLLLVTFHHIVIDAWSIDIFMRELEAFYRAFSSGLPLLPDLPLQYSDFADRQRRWMEGRAADEQLKYWQERLAGAPQVVTFPSDRSRPKILGSKGKRIAQLVDGKVYLALKELARRRGATIFVVLLSALVALLRQYTTQEDLVMGTPVACRHWPETEDLIGLFLNTVVLRNEARGNPGFEDLVGRVRRSFLDALNNQDLPFEKVVEKLTSGRSLSYSPLFQILVVHRIQSGRGYGELVKDMTIGSVGAKFDMTFSFLETEDQLNAEVEFNADIFDTSTVLRIQSHLLNFLERVVDAPSRRILDYDFLRPSEHHVILLEWNDSGGELQGLSVQERFLRQALLDPSAPAVIGISETLTYGDLGTLSGSLALGLAERGVGPEIPVALLVDRKPALVIGVLAVLRAGGVYVPLDPQAPPERLASILADLDQSFRDVFILTQDSLKWLLPEALQRNSDLCISLESEYATSTRGSDSFMSSSGLGNLAYILYTSGSSGTPKGVAVEHRSVAAFLDWAKDFFGPEERRVVLASTPLSFDLSVFELLLPLTTGGCLLMSDPLTLLEKGFGDLPEASLINTVPSLISRMLDLEALPTSITTVNLAGETLQRSVVNRLFETSTIHRLLNLYGPTEATVYATVAAISPIERSEPSLGRPIRNTQVYVVSEMLELQPIGAPGELLISGEGLARGYLNRPALTAERFIPNPHSSRGSRCYRTGDRVRWLPDGRLEFLGRLDRQLKIRGIRIEPAEVEACLLRHPAVREAVVVAKMSPPQGELQLVAYVRIADGQDEIRPDEFRAFLQQLLPRGAVPSAIVLAKDIPRTIRGKIDFEKLPDPDWSGEEAAEFIPPRSPAEKYLANIWSDVLGVQDLSINDNFFERGGHSMRAAQVAARVRQAGVDLPLYRIMEKPQLGQLAQEIEASLSERDFLAARSETDYLFYPSIGTKIAADPAVLRDRELTFSETAEIVDLMEEVLREKACAVKRQPVVSFPAHCTVNSPSALHFQLVALAVDPLLQRLARLQVLRAEGTVTLFIKVTATAFSLSPHLARIQVPADGDSDLVRFRMIPLEPGMHLIEIEVFSGADRVGYFTLETEAAISHVN